MNLSPELEKAAQDFGATLCQDDRIQQYLQITNKLSTDLEIIHFEAMRADLVARQRAGEELPVEEIENFYTLRTNVMSNPIFELRDSTRLTAGSYLADPIQSLNRALALDFVTFVLS